MTDIWELGVREAATAIRDGKLTPPELAVSLLSRIAHLDGEIQAFARINSVDLLSEAEVMQREATSGVFRGPLHGIPIAIKDILDTAGIETCVGSSLLAGRVPDRDATAVAQLRRAGALVLGKTAMTEFAAMDPAPTRNPWNVNHTPGGSSSGSAAAVAAFLAPGAVGTQTAGSIIRPAAYCGIVGLKPTYDAIDRRGVFPCAWSMDHVGPMARSVDDVAMLFEAMASTGAGGRTIDESSNSQLRIGISDRYFLDRADSDTKLAMETVIEGLREAGVSFVQLVLPESFEAGCDAGIVNMYCEMAAAHRDLFAVSRSEYGWKLQCLLDAGMQFSAVDYLRAQQVRRLAMDDLSRILSSVDCLLTPSTPAPAPMGLDATGDWTLNLPFSSSGHPTLTVPVTLSRLGLPIGVQLVAKAHGEERLFCCGALIEKQMKFNSNPFRNH